MLESEEGQNNAVFACFGSAAQHAQLFEQALARFLLVYNRICTTSVTVSDVEAVEAKLNKKTMGWLLQELSKFVMFEDEAVSRRLDKALQYRNYLMHEFFLKRVDELNSEAGRMSLLAELVSIERVLDNARITVNALRIAMCRTLGVPDSFAVPEPSERPT